jgi:TonB family protein
MKKKGRHSTSGFDEEAMKRYLNDEMTSQERHAFEKTMMQSEFEADALEGFSLLPPDQLQEDVAGLRKKVMHSVLMRPPKLYWQVAAVLIFFVSVGALWMIMQSMEVDIPGELAREEARQPDQTVPSDTSEKETETTEVEMPRQPDLETIADASKALSQKPEINIPDQPAAIQAPETVQESMDEMAVIQDEEARQEIAMIPDISDSIHKKVSRSMQAASSGDAPASIQPQGRVLDASDGYPLPGVNVIIKGKQDGVITNQEGKFQLPSAIMPGDSLILSSVGYQNKTIAVFQAAEVQLEPDINALSEVVVTGYGIAQAQQEAKPEGGYTAFRRYVRENLHFPETSDLSTAVVRLSFKVTESGRLTDIKILKSPDKLFEEEAIRLLETGPAWEPAIRQGMTAEQEIRLSIRFKRP